MQSGVTLAFPKTNNVTDLIQTEDGFKIKIRNIDLLDPKEGLIYKSYEDALFLLFYGRYPNIEESSNITEQIQKGFFEGNNIFNSLSCNLHHFGNNNVTKLQALLLALSQYENIEPFFIMGAASAFVINIVNTKLHKDHVVKFNPNIGLIKNLTSAVQFFNIDDDIQNNFFKQMMIAWADLGPSPSGAATMISSSLKTSTMSAIAAGVGAASGLKHTSARIESLKMMLMLEKKLSAIGINCNDDMIFQDQRAFNLVLSVFQEILDNNELIYGFGHYFFKGPEEKFSDPRIFTVQNAIIHQNKSMNLFNILTLAKNACCSGALKKNNENFKLPANSDGYWGIYIYTCFKQTAKMEDFMDLVSIFTVLTRVGGLIAHNMNLQSISITPTITWG